MDNSNVTDAVRAAWQSAGMANDVLDNLRRESLDSFVSSGLPTRRNEAWKYTDLRSLTDTLPAWLGHPVATADTPETELLDVPDAFRITLVDGVLAADLSDIEGLPDGVVLADIADLTGSEFNIDVLMRLNLAMKDPVQGEAN